MWWWRMQRRVRPGHVQLERIAGMDAMWLLDSANNSMIINAVLICDHITIEMARRAIQHRGIGLYPRLSKRVVYVGDVAYWEHMPDTCAEEHVIVSELGRDPAHPATEADVKRLVSEQWATQLPQTRPLWRYEVVEHYMDGRTAVLFRVHHVYGDGLSLVKFCLSITDTPAVSEPPTPATSSSSSSPPPPSSRQPKVGLPKQSLPRLAASFLSFPFWAASKLFIRQDSNPLHNGDTSSLSGTRGVDWSPAIALSRVKEVKRRMKCSLNDVLLSTLAGAVGRYYREQATPGSATPDTLMMVPISTRGNDDDDVAAAVGHMNNNVALVYVRLLTSETDAVRRLDGTRRYMDAMKGSVEVMATVFTIQVLGRALPPSLASPITNFLASKATAVCTNVPGPSEALTFMRQRVHDMMFWVPGMGSIGLGLAILSYAGSVRVGVSVDSSLCRRPELITRYFVDEFEQLYVIAMEQSE